MRMILIWMCLLTLSAQVTKAGESKVVKIGAIFAVTGSASKDNHNSLMGMRAAINKLKQDHLWDYHPVLQIFDNRSTPIGAKIAADQAVKAGVTAIIGSEWSSHSLAAAKVAQANQIPMISNVSTHPDLTKIGDYIFRVCFTDLFQGKVLADFAYNRLKARRAVCLVNITSPYSIRLDQIFQKYFQRQGGQILLRLKYKHNQKDFKKILKQVQKSKPNLVFLPGHIESGKIIKQAMEMGMEHVFIGGDGWSDPEFFHNGGHALNQGYFTTHWSKKMGNISLIPILEGIQQSNDYAGLVLAYDAVMLLADAIQRAGSIHHAKVRTALAETRAFHGLTGVITMNPERNPPKPVVIMKIKKDQITYLETIAP